MAIVFLILSCLVLVMLIFMTYRINTVIRQQEEPSYQEKTSFLQNWLYAAIVLTIVALIISIYFIVQGTPFEGHLMEWLNIVIRVMHFTFGIAWIGASFYFVFLENALNRKDGIRDEIAGDLWAVHGGGFYYLEKYKLAPKTIPRHLHWFKYEAYFTWISGMGLLFVIYYFNASAMLVDNNVLKLNTAAAIAISMGSFIIGWLIYDLLCKSNLVKKPILFFFAVILLLTGFSFFYSQVFSGRAAFIHFGALVGSIMVANVFFVIIPSQKAMVRAARQGIAPDPMKGKKALLRSIHNNYFTLPVLFVMVSNHFPSTFSHPQQWVVLALIGLGSAGIKHWLNQREQGRLSVWVMPTSVLLLLAATWVTAPPANYGKCEDVSFSTINNIIQKRCISCHSSRPTDEVFTKAPNGVVYDTPNDIVKKKESIMQRVVVTETMPQNNKTNMTPGERELVRCWIEQGAELR